MMMKKQEYTAPALQVITISMTQIIAGSASEGENSKGDGQGPITGSEEIGAKGFGSLWDEE